MRLTGLDTALLCLAAGRQIRRSSSGFAWYQDTAFITLHADRQVLSDVQRLAERGSPWWLSSTISLSEPIE